MPSWNSEGNPSGSVIQADVYLPQDDDDLTQTNRRTSKKLSRSTTAARTIQELEAEIEILKGLEIQAKVLVPQC